MKYLLGFLAFIGIISCSTSQVSKYSKIEYEVGPCFGFCPVYKITIDNNRKAILEAEHFNFSEGGSKDDLSKPREGTFTATISKEDYQKLVEMVDNADVRNLKDSYIDERIMDASKSDLRIGFSDGTKKSIQLSAGEKPRELVSLQNYITELKQNQKWTKIK
ncbi:DUF6438 domain-containing protein [Epilithonimonas sp.]|uniref:DUF6438 domain-containing protein n=1 Tax=Epilithonimonas sp. TaxID=2894511 RepID=UPI0035AE2D65